MNMIASINPDDDHRSGDLRCPHCKSTALRRSSRAVTDTFRELFYICRNVACGHTWKASLTYDYGLSPSAIPDPNVTLPLRVMDRSTAIGTRDRSADSGPDPSQPTFFD